MAKRHATTGEAAAYLGITRTTLYRWVEDGLVRPTYRVGKRGDMRWDLDDLDRQLHRADQPTGGIMTDPAAPIRPPIVAAVITSDKGVLITRRHDGRPLWGFPAGEAEPGEAAQDTAIRETKEETTLEVVVSHMIGERMHPKTGRHMIYLAARPYHGTAVEVGDADELAEVVWVDLPTALDRLAGLYEPVRDHLASTLS
jgi:excisionase family DNA binding protein